MDILLNEWKIIVKFVLQILYNVMGVQSFFLQFNYLFADIRIFSFSLSYLVSNTDIQVPRIINAMIDG